MVSSSAGKKLSMASSAMVTSSGEPKTVMVEKKRSSVHYFVPVFVERSIRQKLRHWRRPPLSGRS